MAAAAMWLYDCWHTTHAHALLQHPTERCVEELSAAALQQRLVEKHTVTPPAAFATPVAVPAALVLPVQAELARWMGPELIRAALYDKLRDAQKEDVEKLLQEAPAGRPKPERLTRKEAAKAATATASHASAEGEVAAAAAAVGGAAAAADEEPEQVVSYTPLRRCNWWWCNVYTSTSNSSNVGHSLGTGHHACSVQ